MLLLPTSIVNMAMTAVAPNFALNSLSLSSSVRESSHKTNRRSECCRTGSVPHKHASCRRALLDASCTGLRKEGHLDRLSKSSIGPSNLFTSLANAANVRHTGGARKGMIVAIFEEVHREGYQGCHELAEGGKSSGQERGMPTCAIMLVCLGSCSFPELKWTVRTPLLNWIRVVSGLLDLHQSCLECSGLSRLTCVKPFIQCI